MQLLLYKKVLCEILKEFLSELLYWFIFICSSPLLSVLFTVPLFSWWYSYFLNQKIQEFIDLNPGIYILPRNKVLYTLQTVKEQTVYSENSR